MHLPDFDTILARTLDDQKLSRSERKAVQAVLADHDPDENALAALRARVFTAAAERLHDPRDKALLDWVEDFVKALATTRDAAPSVSAEAAFSPGETCQQRIIGLLKSARREVNICVFTITDNAISEAIVETHQRGVPVRVITDDDKSGDLGSDIQHMRSAGVPVAFDNSDAHMHHKFALFDSETLLTGSYNWTRSAARTNQENIIITDAPDLVRDFQREFQRLWSTFGR